MNTERSILKCHYMYMTLLHQICCFFFFVRIQSKLTPTYLPASKNTWKHKNLFRSKIKYICGLNCDALVSKLFLTINYFQFNNYRNRIIFKTAWTRKFLDGYHINWLCQISWMFACNTHLSYRASNRHLNCGVAKCS